MIKSFSKEYIINRFKAYKKLLEKIKNQAELKQISEEEILNYRLAPDMFPFFKQIGSLLNERNMLFVLDGKNVEMFNSDSIISFDKAYKFIDIAISDIENMGDDLLENLDEKEAYFPWNPDVKMTGEQFFDFWLPNFEFHFTITYALARANGFDIGKMDFIG